MNRTKEYLQALKWRCIGIFGKLFIDGLFLTSKIEVEGWEEVEQYFQSKQLIFAFWHDRLLLPAFRHKGIGAVVLVSQSKDGEIISQILYRQGQKTMRGSSTRGGLRALAGMVKMIKETGAPGAVTPDGPQGPRYEVKHGVVTLAKKTGYPIIPMSFSANRVKIFSSWDRFMLPFPFSTCRIIYGRPIFISKDADQVEEEKYLTDLEEELNRLTRKADQYFNHETI
jgi:lysophospholipid acyltransferase (LPLAT)-like uncharacterized protein